MRAALVLTLLVAAASADAAQLVVMESRGTDLKPGQAVDGSQSLTLKEGQQVVLIAATGQVIKLRGPWDQPPLRDDASSSPDVGAALKAMLTQNLARSEKIGVVRGAAAQAVPPDPWLVDVTHVGTRCVTEERPVVFWRPRGGEGTSVAITPYDRSWRARAQWPAGADRLLVPRALPLHSRSTYVVSLDGKETAITLVAIPAAADNDAMRAAWMIEAGCDGQAQALLQRVR